jgi:hypothetical protein
MRRIVRTGATDLPPSADSYKAAATPAVTVTHPPGATISVMTYAGVKVMCKVVGVRKLKEGCAYDVRPLGDLKVKDFQKAGVPITQDNGAGQFVAFDWQILEKAHT